ncbi:UNVERIFIED_CONTAM: UAA transporter family protein [Hammondia hammondi]|eukprot:XP_008883920.1 UAA transporter family protein [Hammondia hammondi]
MEGSSSLGGATLVVVGMFVPYIFAGLAQRRLYDRPPSATPSSPRCAEATLSSLSSALSPSLSPLSPSLFPSLSPSLSPLSSSLSLSASDVLSYAAGGHPWARQEAHREGCLLSLSPGTDEKKESFRYTFTVLALNCAVSAFVAFLALLLLHLWKREDGQRQRESDIDERASERARTALEKERRACMIDENAFVIDKEAFVIDKGAFVIDEGALLIGSNAFVVEGETSEGTRFVGRRKRLGRGRSPEAEREEGTQMAWGRLGKAFLSRSAWHQALVDVSGTIFRKYVCFPRSSLPTGDSARRVLAWVGDKGHRLTFERLAPHVFVSTFWQTEGKRASACRTFGLPSLSRVPPWKSLFAFCSRRRTRTCRVSCPRRRGFKEEGEKADAGCRSQRGRDEETGETRESDERLKRETSFKSELCAPGAPLSSWDSAPVVVVGKEDEEATLASPFPSLAIMQREVDFATKRHRGSRLLPASLRQGKGEDTDAENAAIRRELLLVSLGTFAAKAASFHSLTVVDFATLAVAKCAKPVGVLILSGLLGRRVSRKEVAGVLWMAVWVYVFNASCASEKNRASASGAFDAGVGERTVGNLVLFASLALDSFSVSRQDHVLLRRHRLCPYTLMLVSSVYGLLFSLVLCVSFEGAAGLRYFLGSVFAASGASSPESPTFLSPRTSPSPVSESPSLSSTAFRPQPDGAPDAGALGDSLFFLSLVSLSPLACSVIVAVGGAVAQLCGSKCMQLVGAVCSSILTTLRRVALVFVALLLQREPVPWLASLAVANICLAGIVRLLSSFRGRKKMRSPLPSPASPRSPSALAATKRRFSERTHIPSQAFSSPSRLDTSPAGGVADFHGEASSPCSSPTLSASASPRPLWVSASCLQESRRGWTESMQNARSVAPSLLGFATREEEEWRAQGVASEDTLQGSFSFISRLPSLSASPASTCDKMCQEDSPALGLTVSTVANSEDGDDEKGKCSEWTPCGREGTKEKMAADAGR